MNIAVSWNAEGKGHFRRIQPLIEHLIERHNLVLFVPKGFEGFVKHYDVPKVQIPSYRLVLDERGIRRRDTFKKNLPLFRSEKGHVDRIEAAFSDHNIEALLVDYERLTSLAAKNQKLPTFAISHQAIFLLQQLLKFPPALPYLTPIDYSTALDTIGATIAQIPYATTTVSSSFYNGDVGGLIRLPLLEHERTTDGLVPVYAKKISTAKKFARQIEKYGFETRVFTGASQQEYEYALAHAPFGVSNAGHQTCCEYIALGKPLLAIPQDKQFEQLMNGIYLELSGRGMMSRAEEFSEKLPEFLRFVQEGFREPDSRVTWKFGDYTSETLALLEDFLEENNNSYKSR